jgi:hypothetical protein
VIGAFRHNIVRAIVIPATFVLLAFHADTIFGSSFQRSFFGVYRISLNENGQFRVLSHGTTVHGAERVANADGSPYQGPVVPLTYYHPDGVLAETFHLLPANPAGRDIAIVGLGAGAQACNGQPQDRVTYFEIDGLVEKIARDPKLFTFMEKCSPGANVILGDARLTLADQPKTYDYLLLDAFSSDSIPVHLLTREAFRLYAARLKDNGLLVLHISNRHMELESVVAALAKDSGLAVRGRILDDKSAALADPYPSSAMALAKSPETLVEFTADRGWSEPATHDVSVWTDDYSNIPAAIWRKYMGKN